MRFCLCAEARSERGRIVYKTVALGLLLAVIGWLGYKLVPLYYYYLDLRNQFAQVIGEQGAVASDEEIRRIVGRVIKRHGVPAEERDVAVQRGDTVMTIELPYREKLELSVMGYNWTLWQFELVAAAQGRYR
jgi:hypothetical protein